MTLFAPDKPVEKSVSTSSSRAHDPELSRAIQNTIAQIRSNPYDMEATQTSLQGLTVYAQNSQRNDVNGSQTVTTNSSQIGANVESLQAQPGNQSELFEKQMERRSILEREALFVSTQVIRQLEELDPEMQLNSKSEKEVAKPTPTLEDLKLDPNAYQRLMGDVNLELEKLGILVNPNKAFLESTIVIEDESKLAAAKELGNGMPWRQASSLSTNQETILANTLGSINGLKVGIAEGLEQEIASPLLNTNKRSVGVSNETDQANTLSETLNTVNGLREDTPLQATYRQGQADDLISAIPTEREPRKTKPVASFDDALKKREAVGAELALSES